MPENDQTTDVILSRLRDELLSLEREITSELNGVVDRDSVPEDPGLVLGDIREFLIHARHRLEAVREGIADPGGVSERMLVVLTDASLELGALRAEAESLRTRVSFALRVTHAGVRVTGFTAAFLRRSASWFRSVFIPVLSSALGKVWRLVSRMLRPKEWKLGGKLGTGIFGFAETSIEITFGP